MKFHRHPFSSYQRWTYATIERRIQTQDVRDYPCLLLVAVSDRFQAVPIFSLTQIPASVYIYGNAFVSV
jgi:hypothetical protein